MNDRTNKPGLCGLTSRERGEAKPAREIAFAIATDIPYGNISDPELTANGPLTEVSFSAHPHGGPEALWFSFRLQRREAAPADAGGVRLVLKNIANLLGGGSGRYFHPVVRYDGGGWQRLGDGALAETPDGRRSLAWDVEAPRTWMDVAWCYPYGLPEVERLIEETGAFWRYDTIGVSQAGRRMLRLSNDYGQVGGDRPGLYLIARQHSGETPGSWVLDGFLRQMATWGERAPLIWAVPLTNIDGIEEGDYGKDNFPYDLNRAWEAPSMRHEVLLMRNDIFRWKERCRPVLALDFHAPGASETGVYFFMPKPDKFPAEHAVAMVWGRAFVEALPSGYAAEEPFKVASYKSRWETPTFTSFCCSLGLCGFSMETAYAVAGSDIVTRENYLDIGARMADAAGALCQTIS